MIRPIDLAVLDRHAKTALSFSGGKDSLAVVYLLRGRLDQLTIYHLDTGDLLPETRAIVAHVRTMAPDFVHIQGDIEGFVHANGLPSDLVPHTAHPVGRMMGEAVTPLIARYDCCWHNLMNPIYQRIIADGNTLMIRGTKQVDMRALPVASGDHADGLEFLYPLQSWSNDEVFAYLREVGAPISRIYDHVVNSPECARCTAWWSEQRAAYLRQYHPALYEDYKHRLVLVAQELVRPMEHLRHELNEMGML